MLRCALLTSLLLLSACGGDAVLRARNGDDAALGRAGFEPEAVTGSGFEPEASAAGEGSATAEGERINRIDTLAPGTPILVDNPYGDVRLRFGGYQHQVELHAVLQQPPSAAAIAVRVEQDDQAWRLLPRLPAGAIQAEGQRLDIVLYVAQGLPVQVLTERGLIEVRGLKGDLSARSRSGNIRARGVGGQVDLQTDDGAIEIALEQAPAGSRQRIQTRTGAIHVGVADDLNARLTLSTSSIFSTEFSLDIEHLSGQEPNKRAQAVVGEPHADLQIDSLRGEIRLLRRAAPFVPVSSVGAANSGEGSMKRAQAP